MNATASGRSKKNAKVVDDGEVGFARYSEPWGMPDKPAKKGFAILRRMGWNQRVLTIDHFYRATNSLGIAVVESQGDRAGYYCEPYGIPMIAINTNLSKGWRAYKTLVAYHELGHALFHLPSHPTAKTDLVRLDLEADLVSYCALLPASLLWEGTPLRIANRLNYPLWIVEQRMELYERFERAPQEHPSLSDFPLYD